MKENSLYDKKVLREITGKNADWNEDGRKSCVAFSNARGGVIDYHIEDDADAHRQTRRYLRIL